VGAASADWANATKATAAKTRMRGELVVPGELLFAGTVVGTWYLKFVTSKRLLVAKPR
jgi:hypothetical protein